MAIFIVLLGFGANEHTSTAHVYCVHLNVAEIEKLQFLLISEQLADWLFFEKPHTESDRINPADGIEL